MAEDWFLDAAKEAEESREAERARLISKVRMTVAERQRERDEAYARATPPPRPREAANAAAIFEAVAAGKAPVRGTGLDTTYYSDKYSTGGHIRSDRPGASGSSQSRPRRPTPTEGLDAILESIAKAGDADAVFKAGGEWISRITTAITEVIREADDEQ